jgi:hypothetical protein
VVIAVPVLLAIVTVALLFGRGGLAWTAAAVALIVGVYLGNTGFGHFIMSLVNSL